MEPNPDSLPNNHRKALTSRCHTNSATAQRTGRVLAVCLVGDTFYVSMPEEGEHVWRRPVYQLLGGQVHGPQARSEALGSGR